MTATDLGPLDWRTAIVDGQGRPSPEFQRRWNTQRNNNALIGSVTFGSGTPTGVPQDGAEYVNVIATPMTLYVGYNGSWHLIGVQAFTDLSDVPHSYAGHGTNLIQVNSGGTALQFITLASLTANPTATAGPTAVNGTASTFMRSDAAPAVQLGSASQAGVVQVDGTTITASGGVISAVGGGGGGALTLIQEIVTSGNQASVTFSSIAATYRDLIVVIRGRTADSGPNNFIDMQFNGDTGSNYGDQLFHGVNTTLVNQQDVSAAFIRAGELPAASATANYSGQIRATIADYRGTTFFKAVSVSFGMSAGGINFSGIYSGQWKSTSAINAIKLFPEGATHFIDGTIVSLYGSS